MRRLFAILTLLALSLGVLPAGQAEERLDSPVWVRGRTPAEIRFQEDPLNGINWVRLLAPSSLPSDVTLTLPSTSGTIVVGGEGADGTVLRGAGIGASPIWGQVRLAGGTVDVTGVPNSLLLGDGTAVSAYAGFTCTNQFSRALSAVGVATCASVSLTADVSGLLPYASGGTNANTSWTQGSVFFAGASEFAQDNANFFWDDSSDNFRLFGGAVGTSGAKVLTFGVGTAPTSRPADSVQLVARDMDGAAGSMSLEIYPESGASSKVVLGANATSAETSIMLYAPGGESSSFTHHNDYASWWSPDNRIILGAKGQWNLYLDVNSNLGIGSTSATYGTGATGTLSWQLGTLPTTGVTDATQLTAHDEGVSGATGLVQTEESGTALRVGGEIIDLRLAGNPAINVVSSSTETSLYGGAKTIKANTLGTFRSIRLEIEGDFLNNTGAGDKFTFRLAMGGATVLTLTPNDWTSNASRFAWRVTCRITASGSVSAQHASCAMRSSDSAGVAGTSFVPVLAKMPQSFHNGITVTTSSDWTLNLTVQNDTNSANESTRVFSVKAYLE